MRKPRSKIRKRATTPKLTPAASTEPTGSEVALLRKRLGWVITDFANLFSVSVSSMRRWEACGAQPIVADPHGRRLLKVLSTVLDTVPDARERLSSVKDAGSHRVLYMLLGLFYRDTPWTSPLKKVA